jgi:hypothetical protein
MRTLQRLAGLLALLCLVSLGCNTRPKLYHVSGKVTYNGKPLPAGVIYFDPDVTKKNDAPQGYAMIKDGEYDTAAPGGQGVVGGAYVARIEGFDGKPGAELPLGRPLFTDYQKAIELPRGPAKQDFDVPSKKP